MQWLQIALLIPLVFSPVTAESNPDVLPGTHNHAAYQYLEFLQEKALRDSRVTMKWQYSEKWVDSLIASRPTLSRIPAPCEPPPLSGKTYREYILEQINRPLPTRYENPFAYSQLESAVGTIKKACQLLNLQVPSNLYFGTLPTGEVNALTIKVPFTSEVLLVFNSYTMNFVHEMTISVASLGDVMCDSSLRKLRINFSGKLNDTRLECQPALLSHFIRTVFRLAVASPSTDTFMFPTHDSLVMTLLNAMELFVVGHEVSHLLLKHTAVEDGHLYFETIRDSVPTVPRSWQQEIEADSLSFEFLYALLKSEPYNRFRLLALHAPLLLTQFTYIVESVQLYLMGADSSGVAGRRIPKSHLKFNHPPWSTRQDNIVSMLSTKLSSLEMDFEEEEIEVALIVPVLIDGSAKMIEQGPRLLDSLLQELSDETMDTVKIRSNQTD